MAELTFKSAGVGTREIDLSGPTSVTPTGTPAGVIGTANRGPAFVPVTVANYQDFVNKFDSASGQFGPLALYEWLKNANAGTYLRVLGVGDGKARTAGGINAGKVTNSGFVVGDKIVQSTGDIGSNAYSWGHDTPGRTYFLGCFMSESAGSTYLSDAGIQASAKAAPIIRGVLMVPSGVIPTLSASVAEAGYTNNLSISSAPANKVGFTTGTLDISSGKQEFVLFLSGHKANDAFGNTVSASFDPSAANYFATLFNTDPTRIEEAGHYLYTAYDVYSQYAVPTGSNLNMGPWAGNSTKQEIAFVLKSAESHNSGTAVVPNYEGFEDRFQTAFSPWVISQRFGDPTGVNLFKVHARDDGAYANTKVKISIRNITPSTDPTSEYGTFDLFVREFGDTDDNQVVLESFVGLSINPNNPRFFGKVIGDMKVYFDFDRAVGSQKLAMEGLYPNVSSYIRVEIADDVMNKEVPASALPAGFRGLWHLVTSGSGFLGTVGSNSAELLKAVQPPVPFRKSVSIGVGSGKRTAPYLHWGLQFEANDSITEPNKNSYADYTVESHVKYFPKYHTDFANAWVGDNNGTPNANGAIYDADVFNNNAFTIERIQVITASSTGLPNPNLWTSASYLRTGGPSAGYRFLAVSDLADSTSRRFVKFTFPVHGGFDGVNIFDQNKSALNDTAAVREMLYSTNQFGSNGPTVASYRKAIDILAETSDVDIQILAIPGIREPGITDYAVSAVESRFDALYIMDIQQKDVNGAVITGSTEVPSVTQTATAFANRVMDTSFAAAYYPDLVMTDPGTGANLVIPPSVSVLGAFALNDKVAYPWFAPAGFTRGALSDVIEAQVKLNRVNLDTLYSSNINPVTTVPGSVSPVVYGQKTMLARQSALDRVNVRRLLIEIRRRVRAVANTILFEPNRESTLARFSSLVDPILKQIQAQSGVDRYKVKIDTTTTTQADVENNTIRGKIFVQPTRSIEFVSLDFVVTNAGAMI